MALALEIVETRASELCLAYDNVVMLAAGYKSRSTAPRKRRKPEACVIFVVRRKWKGRRGPRDQTLPRHLLAYTGSGRRRTMCAVPTDVIEEVELRAQPRRAPGIKVDSTHATSDGAVACAIRLQAPRELAPAMLSCQHVFTPVQPLGAPAPLPSSPVYLTLPGTPLAGSTTAWGGQLRSDGAFSFDVQLAAVQDPDMLKAAVGALRLSPTHPLIGSLDEFLAIAPAVRFAFLVPKRAPVAAMFASYVPNVQGIPYEFMDGSGKLWEHPVHHRLLLVFRTTAPHVTGYGDSGSPIVTRAPRNDGHCLAGMLIAGEGQFSYVMPSWMLFNPSQYSHLPGNVRILPVTG